MLMTEAAQLSGRLKHARGYVEPAATDHQGKAARQPPDTKVYNINYNFII